MQPQVSGASGGVRRPLCRDSGNVEVNAGATIGELALLQRQHSLLQEELLRLRDAESRLKNSEKPRAKLERQVRRMKVCCSPVPSLQQLQEQAFPVGGFILYTHERYFVKYCPNFKS